MKDSSIQWCDDTVNPVMGCDGCELWNSKTDPPVRRCYAGMLHETRGDGHPGFARRFEIPQRFDGRMSKAATAAPLEGASRPEKPWLNGLPRIIFVSDMGDALSKGISFYYLKQEIIDVVASKAGRRHRWLWLSKQTTRMEEFTDWLLARGIRWPESLWAGTSITSASTLPRIDHLLKVGDDTTKRFLSVEPQLEPIDITPWLPKLDWVIQGGESGKDARPFNLNWARDLLSACSGAGVRYFLKQVGRRVLDGEKEFRLDRDRSHGGDWADWPEELRVRQMPPGSFAPRHGRKELDARLAPAGAGGAPQKLGELKPTAGVVNSGVGLATANATLRPKGDLIFRTATEIAAGTSADVKWLAVPWVAEGAITLVDGKPKVAGKSTWVLHLVSAVTSGADFLGEPTIASPVVMLTEEGPETFRRSLRRAGLLKTANLHVLFHQDLQFVAWPRVMRQAVEKCRTIGARLLIVDTLAQFSPAAERYGRAALEAIRPLQVAARGGLAVVCVRHERKSGGEVGDSARGSAALTGAADIILAIQRPADDEGDVRIIHALSRFEETPAITTVELRDDGYVVLDGFDVGMSTSSESTAATSSRLTTDSRGEDDEQDEGDTQW